MVTKILLFTTEGCEGCRIMKNILTKVSEEKNIPLNISDAFDETNAIAVRQHNVKDFPTTLLINHNDDVKEKIIGTTTKSVVNALINCVNNNG